MAVTIYRKYVTREVYSKNENSIRIQAGDFLSVHGGRGLGYSG